MQTAPPSAFVKVGDGNAISWLRYRSSENGFRGLLRRLGTLTMNRIEPAGPGKPGFDVPSSPMPIQNQALRLLNEQVPLRSPPPNPAFPVAARPEPKICRTFKQLSKNPYGTFVQRRRC